MIPDLERAGPRPIYQQIAHWMRHRITSGLWPEHYKLPSETDLAVELGVSRGTARKAIAELVDEGMLVQIHGRGTFVSSKHLEQPLAERLVTFSEDLISKRIPFETHVLEQKIIHPPREVASLLAVAAADEVLYLKRVRDVGGIALILLENYVVADRCPGIQDIDFTRHRLFEALEDVYGLNLDWAQRTFEAQAADPATASVLDIAVGSPVMYMEQLLYLQSGTPIELSNLWLRGDRFRLSATVKRQGTARSIRGTVPG